MIKNVDDFKSKCEFWFEEPLSVGVSCKADEDEVKQLQRIVDLINCDVICELNGGAFF